MRKIVFYFDYVSPYSYLAWDETIALVQRRHLELEIVPILFAGLLNAHGQLGPAEIPAKREYVFKDVMRLAAVRGLKLQGPPSHPFNPLLALRLTQAIVDPDLKIQLIGLLLKAAWQDGYDISDKAVLQLLMQNLGLPAAALFQASESDVIKNQIKVNGERAIADKVFGVPSYIVDGEVFWGHDRLPLLESWLTGNLQIDENIIRDFLSRPATAVRKFSRKNT